MIVNLLKLSFNYKSDVGRTSGGRLFLLVPTLGWEIYIKIIFLVTYS